MKTYASELVAKYGLKRAVNKDGDKIYVRDIVSHNKKRILTLEQLYGCKECCLKFKTFYNSGKVDCGIMFGIIDDVFNKNKGGDIEYERQ